MGYRHRSRPTRPASLDVLALHNRHTHETYGDLLPELTQRRARREARDAVLETRRGRESKVVAEE